MRALAEQTVLTKMLIRQQETAVSLTSLFPIQTEEALNELDTQINQDNRADYVSIKVLF